MVGSGEQLKNLHHVGRPSVDDDSQQLLLPNEEEVSETFLKGLLENLCRVYFTITGDAVCVPVISEGRIG